MNEFGVRYCSTELSAQVDKIEHLRSKLYAPLAELGEEFTEVELFEMRVALREIAGLVRMLERDVKQEEPKKSRKWFQKK